MDACTLPGYWGFFGGDKEDGETAFQALAREIREELEYRVHSPRLVAVQKIPHSKEGDLKLVFAEEYDEAQPLRLHEGQGMRWFSKREIEQLRMAEDDRNTAKNIFSLAPAALQFV
jgi:8-oxo-dGTP pyrophosphatase MutT (NUDIX family)